MELCSGSCLGAADTSCNPVCRPLELFPSDDAVPNMGAIITRTTNQPDICISSSRSSIKQLYDVVSAFNEEKKKIVESIGFGGILMFPALKQINRRFAVWLMSKVDPLSQTLSIDANKRINLCKEDVEHVFGIPCKGKSVFSLGPTSKQTISRVTDIFLPGRAKENRSIKVAKDILERKSTGAMNSADADAFRVAFVIYIMSTLLCPGSKHDYISVDYWNALTEPCLIKEFDWAEYVLKKLFQAVVKVKSEMISSNKVTNINGCSIFLQVLYLDSIDLGFLNIEHDTFPRIRHFSVDVMKSMILADTVCAHGDPCGTEFGKSQLRGKGLICYSWASTTSPDAGTPAVQLSATIELWEVASAFTRVLGVQPLATGPLFFAVSEFEGC